MSGFAVADFLHVTLFSLGAVVILMAITLVIGIRVGRHNVVDVTWGLGFVLIAAVAALSGTGDLWRRLLLLVVVAIWGIRLGFNMFRRSKGKGEDPRYKEMLERASGSEAWFAFRKIYLTQALALWFVSLPVQVSAVTFGSVYLVVVVGAALWLVGVVFETVGDAQMDAFKADPSNKGTVMDRGLWAWTRHPNYFGDSSVWWGIFLISASSWPGVLTILSPVVMTYFLVFATGARLLEKTMSKRDGYPEYQQRTSYFIPWPPRSESKA